MISMSLVTRLKPRTVCVCSTWIQLIHLLLKMVLTLTRQISLATWPSSCTQMIVTVKGIAPYLPTILHGIKRCTIDHRRSHRKGSNLHDLADYAVVQINDTHPSMVIPELIRLLTERGIGMDEAISIVRSMTAYTNHTILCRSPWKMATWILARSGSSLGSNHWRIGPPCSRWIQRSSCSNHRWEWSRTHGAHGYPLWI